MLERQNPQLIRPGVGFSLMQTYLVHGCGYDPHPPGFQAGASTKLAYHALIGAGEGNRTLISWVEATGKATLLHTHIWSILLELNQSNRVCNPVPKPLDQGHKIWGDSGFRSLPERFTASRAPITLQPPYVARLTTGPSSRSEATRISL